MAKRKVKTLSQSLHFWAGGRIWRYDWV